MWRARYELGSFDFEAYGNDEDEARRELTAAVAWHVRTTGADRQHNEWVRDAEAYIVNHGEAYRDGVLLSGLAGS